MMKSILASLLFSLALGIASCDSDDSVTDPVPNAGDTTSMVNGHTSTYDVIQGEIWDRHCITCHAAGTSFAIQSDLILTEDVSYDQLVNRLPKNQSALEDGLELVGDAGLEDIYKSFLWEKINAPNQEHFYDDHPEYGSLMPLGSDFLTNGELEFIRAWIVAGAPREGHVVDVALLNDETRFETVPFEALPEPARGYQFHIEPFEILPNRDREVFIYKELNNEDPIFVHKVEISMAPGSHHFIIYNFDEHLNADVIPEANLMRDVYNTAGVYNFSTLFTMQFHQFVTGTQWPNFTYQFPEGVALRLPENTGFDLNSHYANRSDETIAGEVYANIHTLDESEVDQVAEILWLDNQNILLPAGQVTTLSRDWMFTEERNIFQLFSHAHEHMIEFRIYIVGGQRDGELVYVTFDWEHPPILQLDPPLVLEAGQGLRMEATYDNFEDRDIGFGLLSTDEMMMIFGAYY